MCLLHLFWFFQLSVLYWSITDYQCCGGFRGTAERLSRTHTRIHSEKVIIMKTKHFGSAFAIILIEKEQAKNSMIINTNKQILYQKKETAKKHTKITARIVHHGGTLAIIYFFFICHTFLNVIASLLLMRFLRSRANILKSLSF